MSSVRQAAHYDRIVSDYDKHYFDDYSVAYRDEFILDPLVGELDLSKMRVADLACGSGYTSLYLMKRFTDLQMEGFDISPEACRRYSEATGCPSREFDLTQSIFVDEPYDAAIIIGGLHHCVVNLPAALETISHMVKPGGSLLMFEPNADYLLQFARSIWYRFDGYFDADTEAALSHKTLMRLTEDNFGCQSVRYFGGPAFFLIFNSLVLRVPRGIKRVVAPILFGVERAYNRIPGRWCHSSFTAHWIRKH